MKERNTIVINAYGGAGVGKTTACWLIAAELKKQGFVTEYVPEYAKELVWEKQFDKLVGTIENQSALLNEQKRRIDRLIGQVDFVVTDSPLLLNGIYLNDCDEKEYYLEELLATHKQYNNFNFIVERDLSFYEKEGRIHSLEQSVQKDNEIEDMLKDSGVSFSKYTHANLDNVVADAVETYYICNMHIVEKERNGAKNSRHERD